MADANYHGDLDDETSEYNSLTRIKPESVLDLLTGGNRSGENHQNVKLAAQEVLNWADENNYRSETNLDWNGSQEEFSFGIYDDSGIVAAGSLSPKNLTSSAYNNPSGNQKETYKLRVEHTEEVARKEIDQLWERIKGEL